MRESLSTWGKSLVAVNSIVVAAIGLGTTVTAAVVWALSVAANVPIPILVLIGIGVFCLVVAISAAVLRRVFPARPAVAVMTIESPSTESPGGDPLPPVPPIGDLAVPYFRGRAIRIAELAAEEPLLHHRTFEDCYIYGPAVLLPLSHVEITTAKFAVDLVDDMFFELFGPRRVIGVIGLEHVTFRRCTFRGIGWMGNSELLGLMKKATRGAPSR